MTALRLLAEDDEDLKIVSAHLQDAVIRIGDMIFQPKHHRFVAVLDRFCWEGCGAAGPGSRVRAGLHFDSVLKVQSQNMRQTDPEAVAVLLAIEFTPSGEGAGYIDLFFAGGGRIRLHVECIDAVLRDMAEPRPAVARPAHDLETS